MLNCFICNAEIDTSEPHLPRSCSHKCKCVARHSTVTVVGVIPCKAGDYKGSAIQCVVCQGHVSIDKPFKEWTDEVNAKIEKSVPSEGLMI